MKKIILIVLALAMLTAFLPVAALAANPDYLTETVPEGKIDVIENVHGILFCSPDATSGGEPTNGMDLETLLSDGIIAARTTLGSFDTIDDRIHLNVSVAKGSGVPKTVQFPGIEDKFYYAIEFKGLSNVTIDSFTLYYSAQNDSGLGGRDIPDRHVDTDVALAISTDNGATYSIVYSTTGSKFTGLASEQTVTENGEEYRLRKYDIDLEQKYTDVTNVVYISPNGRGDNNGWPARISEISVFGNISDNEAPATPEADSCSHRSSYRGSYRSPQGNRSSQSD